MKAKKLPSNLIGFVLKSGNKLNTPNFLISHKNNQTSETRIAVIVSKKIAQKATKRNRIKRIIKEVVRKIDYTKKGLDFIILAKNSRIGIQSKEAQEELKQIIAKI